MEFIIAFFTILAFLGTAVLVIAFATVFIFYKDALLDRLTTCLIVDEDKNSISLTLGKRVSTITDEGNMLVELHDKEKRLIHISRVYFFTSAEDLKYWRSITRLEKGYLPKVTWSWGNLDFTKTMLKMWRTYLSKGVFERVVEITHDKDDL